jgi:uncharacterized repeat protein (TIGR02543 family)
MKKEPAATAAMRCRPALANAFVPLMLAAALTGCGGGGSGSSGGLAVLAGDSADGTRRIASAAPAAGGGVMINEVNAGNWKDRLDEDGDAEDWVELYNPGSSAVNLTGYGLSNKTATPFLWAFPAGTTVAARSYLTVWLSKKDRAVAGRELHANFNLDNGGDSVYLTASNATAAGILVDSATPPLVKTDQSWCRMPSGAATSPFMVCEQPSFNAANAGTSYASILAKPVFSVRSGFYASAQTVSISGPAGATLRYTTDGSAPTAASAAYTAPLAIAASTVLRVAAFADNAAPSLVETATYLVGPTLAAQYANLKTVMVTIEPRDLVSFEANDTNYRFRAAFEMVSGNTTTVFKLDAEGSAGGNAGSADSPIRTMNVAARDTFGAKSFPGVLWPDKPTVNGVKKLRLRNGSNDWDQAHLRDQLSQRISRDGPNLVASASSVAMFLNGRYYGLMDLREREDENLPASNLGLDKDYVDYLSDPFLDGQEIKNGGQAALDAYGAMRSYVLGNNMAVAANYSQARTLLNPESLAYDWALHMFHANYDWPYHNVHVWRSPELDGRWTWKTHDMDWAFGLYTGVAYNMNGSFTGDGSQIINALLRNTEFRNLYLNTVADQMNVMSPAYMTTTLNGMADEMRPYVADYYAKMGLGPASNWEARIEFIRGWFAQREPIYDGHNRSQFGLAAREAISVGVNDLAMGSVSVNLVDTAKYLTPAQPVWAGRYYPGVPITLEAKPRPGYAFVGWQGASTATTRRITQTLVSGAAQPVQLTAVFAASGAPAAPVLAPVTAPAVRTGDIVSVKLQATDPGGYPVTYSASSLPKGLSLNATSGVIYGRATTPGSYSSTLRASNGVATGSLAVVWTVSDRPGTGLLGTSPDSGPPPNVPPTVALTAPVANAAFTQGQTIAVSANAADSDGTVSRVDFFDGSTLIGSANAAPFSIGWTGAAAGLHTLTAKAYDNSNASTTSAAVSITVNIPSAAPPPAGATACASEGQTCTLPAGSTASVWYGASGGWALRTGVSGSIVCSSAVFGDPLIGVAKSCVYVVTSAPPANVPPTVTLTSPLANAVFTQGTAIALAANAADSDGSVVRVDFYDGSNLIGSVGSAPFSFSWQGAAPGAHSLTARAFDNTGAATTSAAVAITVNAVVTPPPAGSGTGLQGQYFATLDLSGAAVLTRTEAVDFNWGTASPGAGVPSDFFSARWTGLVEAPTTGNYQFQTNSDDGVRVTVNGQVLINNFTPHGPTVDTSAAITLVAGQRYSIVVEYQEYTGGALVQLRWKAPGDAAFTVVPASRLYTGAALPPATGTGLLGQYFATLDLAGPVVLTRTEAVDFNWGTASPGAGVPADFFSARWSGLVEAPISGSYQFQTNSDDGVRVSVNGQVLINNFTPHGPTVDTSAAINLVAGQRYSIVVEYQEYTGGALMQLRWKTPADTAFAPVPANRLYLPTAAPAGGSGGGLLGQYFATLDLAGAVVLTRTEAVDFNWGTGSPGAGVPADFFSARWTGLVEAPASGSYQFQTNSDDGVRVSVNGQVLINNFTPHGPTVDTSAAVTLVAGQRYSIVVEYQEYTGGALMQLRWKTPGDSAFAAVPASRLYLAP